MLEGVYLNTWLVFTWVVLFGLLLGSFANVVIYRVPLKLNIAWPNSYCPHCRHPILWRDNIPVLSWFLLRGKCRHCKQKISIRYPLVELMTGILGGCLYLRYGLSWNFIEVAILVWGLIVVTFIDWDHMLIPDVFTWPGIFIGLVGALLSPERKFLDALGGFAMGFGFLWAVAAIYLLLRKEEGMGGGDIKLMGWIGAVLGWGSIPFVILMSSVIGSGVGIIWAFKSKTGLKSTIPFGPYLALAALFYIFGGHLLSHWYFSFFFPSLTPSN